MSHKCCLCLLGTLKLGRCSLLLLHSLLCLFITTLLRLVSGRSRHSPGCPELHLHMLRSRRWSLGPVGSYRDVSLLTAREEIGNNLGRVVLSWKNEFDTLLNRIGKYYSQRRRRKGMKRLLAIPTWGLFMAV